MLVFNQISTRPKNFMHRNHIYRVLGPNRISMNAIIFWILLGTGHVRCVDYVSGKCTAHIIMVAKAATLLICAILLLLHQWIDVHALGVSCSFILFLDLFFNIWYIFQNVIYYGLFMQLLHIFLIHNNTTLFLTLRFWNRMDSSFVDLKRWSKMLQIL